MPHTDRPGFSLALYLQLMPIVSLVADSLSQLTFLTLYPLAVPKSRSYQVDLMLNCSDLTVLINAIVVVFYVVYVYPFDGDVAYGIVFFVQVPLSALVV